MWRLEFVSSSFHFVSMWNEDRFKYLPFHQFCQNFAKSNNVRQLKKWVTAIFIGIFFPQTSTVSYFGTSIPLFGKTCKNLTLCHFFLCVLVSKDLYTYFYAWKLSSQGLGHSYLNFFLFIQLSTSAPSM